MQIVKLEGTAYGTVATVYRGPVRVAELAGTSAGVLWTLADSGLIDPGGAGVPKLSELSAGDRNVRLVMLAEVSQGLTGR